MKIVDVVAHVLSTPLEEPFAFSQGRVRRRSWSKVRTRRMRDAYAHGLRVGRLVSHR